MRQDEGSRCQAIYSAVLVAVKQWQASIFMILTFDAKDGVEIHEKRDQIQSLIFTAR